MNKLISIELYKIFKRPRTYIGFAAIALIVIIVQLGFYFEGQDIIDFVMRNLQEKFIFEGNLINVYTMTYVLMNSLWIHVPILVVLVTGDLLAGEANSGTFRILLTRPVSRIKLLGAKFTAGFIYYFLLISFLMSLSLLLGMLLFGEGDLLVVKKSINIFTADDILWRFGATFLYAILTMTTVAALSFLLSATADNSLGPIVGTIAIIIGVTIISTLGYSIMGKVNLYLFTSYLPSWQLFFDFELHWEKLLRAIIVNVVYTIGFLSYTFYHFNRKDILS